LCLIWGSTWLFIKLGLSDLPPFTFAGIRFLIASAILIAIIATRGTRLPRKGRDWLLLAITGVIAFTFNYGLLFWGEQYISSGLAALLQSTTPAFGLVMAHFYLPGERITLAKVIGVLMGVAGVSVIFSNQLTVAGPRALAGSAALVLSAVCVAYSNVLVKAYCRDIDSSIIATGQILFGFAPLLVIGISFEGNPLKFHWTVRALVALFYLAIVGTVIAFLFYYWLVHHMDVTKTMLIALVTPVVAVTLGMIVLHEQMNWRTLAGGALIISGISLIVLRRTRKQAVDEVELVTGS